MGVFVLNEVLDDPVDRHSSRPAVACDGHETDFERFEESVEWLVGDLMAQGVQTRQRVGLCISGGLEFLLAFHALIRLDAVVVPMDPFDVTTLSSAKGLDLHHVVSHRGFDTLVEETVELVSGRRMCPMFDVAGEFTLIVVSENSPLQRSAGLILNDDGYRFWSSSQVAEHVDGLRGRLDLDADARAVVCEPWSSPCAALLVLACAASGSCVQVIPESGGGATVLEAVAGDDVSVVFAGPALMHDVVRGANAAGSVAALPRMVLPYGEVLPAIVQRRAGLIRHTPDEPAVYEFDPRAILHDGSSDATRSCECGSRALLTVS
ncbi:AMP-binding protein [Williamsia sp.]|uniref:AMP-binding protein n=1 Tax=Williamsia sp. TaxID=1872085 RepID=UPI002F94CD21